MAMTYQERIAMETKVRAMLTSGMTTAQMADELGISQQAAHRFITRRGWQTMQVVSDADLHEQIAQKTRNGIDVTTTAAIIGRTEDYVRKALEIMRTRD